MATGSEVAARARQFAEQGKNFGVGMCLMASRSCAGIRAKHPDAATAWRNAKYRHSGTPPRGAFAFWTGGARGHGHIAPSDGSGFVWSTDIKRPGRFDRVSLAYLATKWPNLRYVGWAEDVNGVRVHGLIASPALVRLSDLRPGARGGGVKTLQLALRRAGFAKLNPSGATGFYGEETRAMVRAFQKSEASLDGLADGVPGPRTAALLGLSIA